MYRRARRSRGRDLNTGRTKGIQQPADVKVCRLCYILLVGDSPSKIDDPLKMRMCAGLEYIQKQEVCRNDILETRKAG